MSDVILSARHLCKHYPLVQKGFFTRQTGVLKACHDVSVEVKRGETLGIVGESGSGKTTLGRASLRATRPTSGQVLFHSNADAPPVDLATLSPQQLKPLRTELQMIFQDPSGSLNPRMTVQQIVAEPLVIHKLASGSELDDRVVAMLRRVGIRPPDAPGQRPCTARHALNSSSTPASVGG